MPLRKHRVIQHGLSNHSSLSLIKNKTSLTFKLPHQTNITKNKSINLSQSLPKFDASFNTTTEHHPFYFSGIPQRSFQDSSHNLLKNSQSTLTKKLYRPKQKKSQQEKFLSQNAGKTLQKIRNTYKYNVNLRKIAKAWGFDNKGYISKDKFQQIVNTHFDSSIKSQDCEQMLKSVGNDKQNIDMLSFVKLVFDQQPFTKPNINVFNNFKSDNQNQNSKQPTQTLLSKITNLNEGNLLHKNMNQHLTNQSLYWQTQSLSAQNKNYSGSLTVQKSHQMQKTQPSLYQTMHSCSSPKFTFFSTKSHGDELSPTLYYGQNQQKTRFGATPEIKLNDQSLIQNKRQKIFDSKQKVLNELVSQQKLQKLRYMNKLERIREHQQKEKENILVIDKKMEERDNANMKKLSQENLAYNYVNFVHNDWK